MLDSSSRNDSSKDGPVTNLADPMTIADRLDEIATIIMDCRRALIRRYDTCSLELLDEGPAL